MTSLVVLTGAGISAESGLQTFRDSGGLWAGHDVMAVASPEGWLHDPRLVLDFYNQRRREVRAAGPHAGHQGLAELEELFQVRIITQNIDDLHERAGSSCVLHLHGEIFKKRSEASEHLVSEVTGDMEYGERAPDGSLWRPDVVWFGEAVPRIEQAAAWTLEADAFVVIGTSLQVYPAAGLIGLLPLEVPLYVLDPRIPPLEGRTPRLALEQPAAAGISALKAQLIQDLL